MYRHLTLLQKDSCIEVELQVYTNHIILLTVKSTKSNTRESNHSHMKKLMHMTCSGQFLFKPPSRIHKQCIS